MSEITRQQAIEILKAYSLVIKDQQAIQDAIELAVASLEVDEAYQLEYGRTAKGTWQQINKNEINVVPEWRCSECGAVYKCFDMDFEYCPICGAKMEGNE